MSTRTKILIADDHRLIVDALTMLLEKDFDVVGAVYDGLALLPAAYRLQPDVVLLDLGMPLLNGLDAGRRLKTALPRTKVIVFTMNEDQEVAATALRTFASGYLLKSSAGSEMMRAIRDVIAGQPYITPLVARWMQDRKIRDPRPEHINSLTDRQREVLQLLAEGKHAKEIADLLSISPRTVAFHKQSIMDMFGIRNNFELVRLAMRENLVYQES
jgi:DNA-binding NarL/FixJ family response regulator